MRIRITVALAALLALPVASNAQQFRPAADSAWIRGDRPAARNLYLECVRQDETDAVALFRLGLMAAWDGRHDESIEWLDRLLVLQPANRDARVARARAVAASGNLQAAIAAVDSVLTGWPDETGALVARARFASWERDNALAERLWRRAIQTDPRHAGAHAGLAGTLRQTGRLIEARAQAAIALQAEPADTDVRNASDHVERLFRPRVRSAVIVEDDSDGNAVTSVTAGGGFRLTDRIDVSADAWTRTLALDVAASAAHARGGNVRVALDAPSGWKLGGSVGARGSSEPGAVTSTALGAFAASPADRTTVVTVDVSRTPVDYTLPLVRNRVVVTAAGVSIDARRGRTWDFNVSASLATWDVRVTGDASHRTDFRTSARRRINDRLALSLGARAFGFDRDIDGGFFDPDSYGLLDVALAWHLEPARWLVDAEIAPGVQRIGSGGDVTGAVRASASAAWQLRPGRQLGLRLAFANAGLQQLSADRGEAYRYGSLALSFSWWF